MPAAAPSVISWRLMNRRSFLNLALGFGTLTATANAALAKMKITRVRFYHAPNSRPMFNQSFLRK